MHAREMLQPARTASRTMTRLLGLVLDNMVQAGFAATVLGERGGQTASRGSAGRSSSCMGVGTDRFTGT